METPSFEGDTNAVVPHTDAKTLVEQIIARLWLLLLELFAGHNAQRSGRWNCESKWLRSIVSTCVDRRTGYVYHVPVFQRATRKSTEACRNIGRR